MGQGEPDALERAELVRRVKEKLFGSQASIKPARYMPLERVGSGGGGTVYRAYDQKLRREVAIKLVHGPSDQGGVDPKSVRLILREARSIAALSHPNIVAVHDVGHVVRGELISDIDDSIDPHTEGFFVVMEYVHGLDLHRWLREKERSWAEIREVFLQAAAGLQAAHRQNIVHRDFKPSNVLVGVDGRVRVIDFGLARLLSDQPDPGESQRQQVLRRGDGSSATFTKSGILVGTPAYMAPECLEARDAGPRSDQYSFCVALFEAVYGVRPEPCAVGEVPSRLPEALHSVPRETPPQLDRVLARGLAYEPERRYPDLETLAHAIRGHRSSSRLKWWIAGIVVTVGALTWAWPRERDDGCKVATELSEPNWGQQQLAKLNQQLSRAELGLDDAFVLRLQERFGAQRLQLIAQREARCRERSANMVGWSVRTHADRCLDFAVLQFQQLVERGQQLQTSFEAAGLFAAALAMADPSTCSDTAFTNASLLHTSDVNWGELARARARSEVAWYFSEYPFASKQASIAWSAAKMTGDPIAIAKAGRAAGLAALATGDYIDARDYLQQAYYASIEAERRSEQGEFAVYLAELDVRRGETLLAQTWLDHARALLLGHKAPPRILARWMTVEHEIALARSDDPKQTLSTFAPDPRARRELPQSSIHAQLEALRFLWLRASLHREGAASDEGILALEELAQELAAVMGPHAPEVQALGIVRAAAHLARGEAQRAQALLEASLSLVSVAASGLQISEYFVLWAWLQIQLEQLDVAADSLVEAMDWIEIAEKDQSASPNPWLLASITVLWRQTGLDVDVGQLWACPEYDGERTETSREIAQVMLDAFAGDIPRAWQELNVPRKCHLAQDQVVIDGWSEYGKRQLERMTSESSLGLVARRTNDQGGTQPENLVAMWSTTHNIEYLRSWLDTVTGRPRFLASQERQFQTP